MSLDNISNQYDILMSDSSSKNEKKAAYKVLSDYAHVQNVAEAWMLLALYYMDTKKPIGISFFSADRYHKALDCLNVASSDPEYCDTANLLILNLLCDGSTKNKSKAYTQAKKLLNPPFAYDYENQVSIFSQLMGIVADDVQSGAIAPSIDNPPPGYIDEFVALWSHYQERHKRSGRSPEAELNMKHESYAFAHYTFLERYIEKKLHEGYQGAYWAYGFVFSNQCNHLLHRANRGSKEFDELEVLFMNGVNNNDLGALRAIPELYYVEKAKHLFTPEMVSNAITRLKDKYPEEYESMISDLEADGITI